MAVSENDVLSGRYRGEIEVVLVDNRKVVVVAELILASGDLDHSVMDEYMCQSPGCKQNNNSDDDDDDDDNIW